MTKHSKQSGFSAVELLVTLFVAAIFLITGYQLYGLITKDSGVSKAQIVASREVSKYISKYKSYATEPCSVQNDIPDETPNIAGLSNTTLSVDIDCPYSLTTPVISRITATLTYGNPQQTVTDVSYVKPTCPDGFIGVPGSTTYGTSDFCVMKYEAKNAGGNVPVSQPSGVPWTDTGVSQPNAAIYSTNVAGCSGCHLITDAEWMTIAQNVLSVPSNWSNAAVGNGYIYSGHNDNAPASSLAASSDDTLGYTGETNTGGNQRRTLTLTNGEVIWDFAGNVWEWTSGQASGGQPGGTTLDWREWSAVGSPGSLSPNSSPANTGITGAELWNSGQGIGQISSDSDEAALRGIARGGDWDDTTHAGVLGIYLNVIPGYTSTHVGFRVAK